MESTDKRNDMIRVHQVPEKAGGDREQLTGEGIG